MYILEYDFPATLYCVKEISSQCYRAFLVRED